MSRVLQAVDSIHQVGIYCLALVPPNYLPKVPLLLWWNIWCYSMRTVLLLWHEWLVEDALVLRGWKLSSRTWNPITSPRMKQLTWIRIIHSGDWCLCLAQCTPSGAFQKWRRSDDEVWVGSSEERWLEMLNDGWDPDVCCQWNAVLVTSEPRYHLTSSAADVFQSGVCSYALVLFRLLQLPAQ